MLQGGSQSTVSRLANDCVQPSERRVQTPQVVFVGAWNDVQIERGHRSAVQNGSDPTDDDKFDTSLDERPKKLCDVSLLRTTHG